MANEQISSERINEFLSGKDPMLGIIAIECGYQDENVSIIYKDIETGEKKMVSEGFRPFVWAKQSGARKLFIDYKTKKQDTSLLKKKMIQYGIEAKGLNIYSEDGKTTDRLEQGYRVMFRATKKMSYSKFMRFFKEGDVDLYGKEKEFLAVTPVEQHMMRTGKRMFKGFEDYNELTRLEFDLETQGLDPETDCIDQIGIRTNKGFKHIIPIEGSTKEELEESELSAIELFFSIISEINPDVITGHNSENFDWSFIIKRLEVLGYNIKDVSGKYFKQAIYKKAKPTVLKLGGEMEFFNQTILWGCNITDSLHAVRRAQAIDSNMKEANLKYVTKYSKLNKPNRIYVPGDKIKTTYHDIDHLYALNNTDGTWYQINEKSVLKEGYESVTGRYVVERYLLDDLDETDKVELRYNQSNFLLGKILPTSFTKVCTMGTAGTWKLIMMAWSYENNLAIPDFDKAGAFTGGLSRLMQVGFVGRVVKLDFNSLYPAITLTWDIKPSLDISNVMMALLGYILDQRELFKELKGDCKKKSKKCKSELQELIELSIEHNNKLIEITKWDSEESANDKKQLPFKIFANSFFGSFGAPNVFPWGDLSSAEKITCIGRQCLRLMTYWFKKRGYNEIVMDTDGANYSMPPKEELDKVTYVGKGLNRNTVEGKVYKGVEAHVSEFSDLFLRGKMGLGIDEYADSTINFSRKNYADLLDNGEIKYVGNSIKSKRMPLYIEKFLATAIVQLLNNDGKAFIEHYYDYIERIYNYDIPLIEIASKGKIKKTMKAYVENCKGVNKAGNPNSRQAWYELCLKNNIEPSLGDTIYYINIGTKKGDGDCKMEKIYEVDSEGNPIKVSSYEKNGELSLTKTGKQKTEKVEVGKKVVLNCVMVPQNLLETEMSIADLKGTELENVEYNCPKYIDQFNNRIKPLLVCFHPDIRSKIIIKNPNERQFFSEKECTLTSGFPNKATDQDTYEQLMKMEDKEIKFWTSVNEIPPFVNDINMDWENVVKEYERKQEILKQTDIEIEVNKFNEIIDSMSKEDVEAFNEESKLPKGLLEFLKFEPVEMNFISKTHNVVIGSIYDIIDKEFKKNEIDDLEMVVEYN
jgi:DNA polymerase elongation subunit (family B)